MYYLFLHHCFIDLFYEYHTLHYNFNIPSHPNVYLVHLNEIYKKEKYERIHPLFSSLHITLA